MWRSEVVEHAANIKEDILWRRRRAVSCACLVGGGDIFEEKIGAFGMIDVNEALHSEFQGL